MFCRPYYFCTVRFGLMLGVSALYLFTLHYKRENRQGGREREGQRGSQGERDRYGGRERGTDGGQGQRDREGAGREGQMGGRDRGTDMGVGREGQMGGRERADRKLYASVPHCRDILQWQQSGLKKKQ